MSILITAALASAFADGVPNEICYIPEGESKITPFVNGKAKEITVKVPREKGEAITARLQAALADRQKSNVRPWFDFEHKNGVAAALPKSFRYQPGTGIMCAVEWTGAGRTAIEGKDYSYLSPTFLIDDDGTPSGLPERGPLAALLNEPAFREIPRIAASDAASQEPNTTPTMSKLIFAALAISAAAENAETEAVNKITAMQGDVTSKQKRIAELECELADLKKAKDDAEAKCAEAAKLRADTIVKAAVADGRILAKDTEKQDKFRAKIEAGDTFAEEILAQLPKLNQGLDKPVVLAADGKQVQASDFEAKAKALVTAGDAKDIDEAFGIVAATDPTAYSAYLKTLG